jgi:hypothetical protein
MILILVELCFFRVFFMVIILVFVKFYCLYYRKFILPLHKPFSPKEPFMGPP